MITSNSYIDYSKRLLSYDDGTPVPSKLYFKNTKWNEKHRLFTGIIDHRPNSYDGMVIDEYFIKFSQDFNKTEWVDRRGTTIHGTSGVFTRPPSFKVTDKMYIAGDEWTRAAYLILDHPLSTAVIVAVDKYANPLGSEDQFFS